MPANFRFNIKSRLIISGVLFALGLFIIFQISLSQIQDISPAHAAEANKLRGWGWSENIGWISMNCYNDFDNDGDFENCCPGGNVGDCPYGLAGGDYGVHYNTTNGKLTGYAWADGIGWICFGETCQTVCLGGTNNGGTCSADIDCPGGVCGGQPPHGLPVSWACIGRPTWTCQGGSNPGDPCFKTATKCLGGGLCRFSCSDDAGEDFVNSVDPKDKTTTYCSFSGENSHLKAHWKMNSIVTGTILDEANSNTGTLMPESAPPIQAQGKFSNGLQFDGAEDYVDVADSVSLSVTGNLTIEAWVKRRGNCVGGTNPKAVCVSDDYCIGGTCIVSGEQTIVGKWDELAGIKSYRLWFDINNRLNFAVSDGTNTATITQKDGICLGENTEVTQCLINADCATGEICKNAPIIDTKKWHHVSGKYIAQTSDNNPGLKIFIDGSKVPTSAVVGTIPNVLIDQTEKLYIGAKKGATVMDTYFNGLIDNVSIWSCINVGKLRGRQPVDIWDDAKIEIDGWARVINLGEKGWLKLKGFTKDARVWGSFLDNYTTFYTFNGYMANRWVDESMDSNGLVAHWKMNEPNWDGTSNEVVDASGNTNHGTTYSGANVTKQGLFKSAGDFDGVDDYVSVADSNTLDVSQITLIGWIKPDISNIAGAVIEKVSTYGIRLSSGKMNFVATTQNNAWSSAATNSATTMSSGIWYHVAITYDGTTARYYLNGSADGTDTSRTGDIVASTQPVKIGLDTNSIYTNGFIDNLAIYNRVLTPTEILAAYNKSTPACVGWDDYEHEYGDPPAPLPFNSLSVANGDVCTQLLVYWKPSTWAESYTYWRCNSISESDCTSCSYTETNVLDESCAPADCNLTDGGLNPNTGYCYKIQAHNETGSTWTTDNPPTYPAPYWKATTLCAPAVLPANTKTCGQIILNWTKGENTDGYNIYRSLAKTGNTSCDDLTNNGCELTGHLAEAMDYNADNNAVNDLIAQWKMNEPNVPNWNGTNKEVKDSSARTPLNNGTAHCVGVDCVEPKTTTGIFDRAGIFDGVDDYVSANDRAQFDLGSGDNITIEAWINLKSAPTGYNMIISKGYSPGYEFRITSSKYLQFLNVATGYLNYYITSNSPITTTDGTTWYHVAVTKNNTTGAAKLYINGVLDNSATMDTLDYSNNDEIRIGRDADDGSAAGTAFFTGYIDNLAFYNVAKTAEQIRIDYGSGINSNCVSSQCGLAYVCDDGTAPHDKCGTANTCCYTDSRIIPYINYYYRITATGETGETPPSTPQTGPEKTICFPAPSEQEE